MAWEPRNFPERPTIGSGSVVGWVLARGVTAWNVLEFSATYLAVIAAVEVMVVRHLLGLVPTLAPVVVALLTFAVYANDRLVDVGTDGISNPRRTAFVRRHRDVLYVAAAVAYGLAAAFSALGGPVAFALAFLPGLAWVLYAVDWVPTAGVPFRRLKEVAVVNSVLIALAWSLTVVFLPLAFTGIRITPVVVVVFAYFALATFVNAEVANVCDIESDREGGVSTLPVAVGVGPTRQFLYALVLVAAGIVGTATVGGYLSSGPAAALGLGLACLLGVVASLGRVGGRRLLPVAAECTRLPVFVALALPGLVA